MKTVDREEIDLGKWGSLINVDSDEMDLGEEGGDPTLGGDVGREGIGGIRRARVLNVFLRGSRRVIRYEWSVCFEYFTIKSHKKNFTNKKRGGGDY